MGATASLDRAELSVEPGATASATLRIRNTGRVVDHFSVEILGPAAEWSHLEPPSIPLFPGQDGTLTLIVAPPRSPSVPAGSCPFGLKVHAAEDPENPVVEEGAVTIGAYFDVTAELVPRTSRGRRRGVHDLAVDNRSNVPFNADFTGSDPDSLLGFGFNPPVISITPGNAGFTKVRVRPRRRFWRGTPVTRPFEVQVHNDQFPLELQDPAGLSLEGDRPTGPTPLLAPPAGAGAPAPTAVMPTAVAPTLAVEGSMLQEAMLPPWLPQVVAVVVALALLLTLLWFTLFKPQIKSAAKDQVARQLAAAGITTTTTVPGESKSLNGSSSPVAAPGSAASSGAGKGTGSAGTAGGAGTSTSSGTPVDGRLGVTGNSTQSYTVPTGKTLQLTDIDFQNPAGDTGTIILARNDAVLFQLSLADFRDLDYHWISPIVFTSGNTMSLITTGCSATCSPGMYYAGYLASS